MIQDSREDRFLALSIAFFSTIGNGVQRLRSVWPVFALSCALTTASGTATLAQELGGVPAMEADVLEGGAPMSQMGGGDFFSQELGTLLRLRYNTEGYGQYETGNLDIGAMRIANFEDAIGFFDGQVTLSDENGVGYNLGVGFRWLGWAPFPLEPERITGFSFWTDGTSTDTGNFFPQVGVSYESLGDLWDLRVNGYIPLGQESQLGTFSPTGNTTFQDNFLVSETFAIRNTSLNVGEAEIARRIMPDRDAWAFAGPYVLANDDQDSAGYRVGVRGYAYPDLLVQLAVTDDEIFKTNTTFSVTWFVGRTRTNFRPAYGLADRMREPVMRNDYVALARDRVLGGNPLTNTNGDAFRFVHVNSAAAPGGDGTFENPLNNVGNVFPNSQDSDIVLLYSDSLFQNQNPLVLRDNQRLLGEGNNEIFQITTQQQGVIDIPETSPGARAGARPVIMDALGLGAVQLADANEVANFNIDGGLAGLFSPGTGAGNPNIHDMNISDTTGDGIVFTPLTRTNTTNPLLKTVAGNVTIDDVVFDNVGGNEININSFTAENLNDPNVALQETIVISDVTSTNGNGRGVWLQNTHSGRTASITNYTNGTQGTAGSGGGGGDGVLVFAGTGGNEFGGNVTLTNLDIFEIDGYALDFENVDTTSATTITNNNGLTYDGGSGTGGGMRFDNFDGTITGNSSTLRGGTLDGVRVTGVSDGTITLNSSVTFTAIDGTVINVGPDLGDSFTGLLTVSGDITANSVGQLVSLQRLGATSVLTLTGDMTDVENADSLGIFVGNNTAGIVLFSGDITVDTTGANRTGILLDTNGTTDISFNGLVDITTDGLNSNGFDARDGGMLTMLGTTNTVSTNGSTAVRITDMAISNAGAAISEVNVSNAAGAAANGIFLQSNTGGPIVLGTVGDLAGESGVITGTSGDAIVIQNSDNVTVSGIRVDNTAAVSGVRVTKTTAGTQIVNLNDLETNAGDIGIEVTGNGTGTLNMTVNDTNINSATATGLSIDDIDAGTVQINNVMVDGNGAMANAGISISNSNAAVTIDGNTVVQEVAGTAFNVNNGTGTISMAGDITNTVGRSIAVQNRTGGTTTFTATNNVTDSGTGILVNNNTGGTVNLVGDYELTTGANPAVTITNNTGSTTSIGQLDITTTTGSGFVATGGGTLSVVGITNTIESAGGIGLQIEGMTIGAVDFESVNQNGGTHGIRLVNNTGGTVTVGDTGAAVGAGGTIENTDNVGVFVENTNVTLNGVTVEDANGTTGNTAVEILHTNATAMNANLNRLTVQNQTQNGVLMDGTGGTGTFNANVQNLVVNVGSDGLTVDDGVTLTAGGTNTITSATGTGLTITDTTIAPAGANFQSITVTAGTGDGVAMENVTGGQVAITGTGTTLNSGGAITTAGTAVRLTNVENVDLRNLRIINSATGVGIDQTNAATTTMDVTIDNLNLDGATGDGINVLAASNAFNFAMRLLNSDLEADVVMSNTGAGPFGLLVEDTDIDVTGIDTAFLLTLSSGATTGDVTLRDGNRFTTDTGQALFIDTFDATNKDVKILVEDSMFVSNGVSAAADIRSRGNTLMNLTVQGNTFDSINAPNDLDIRSSGAQARMRLNLGGDDPSDFNSATGAGTMIVRELAGSDFRIFEVTETIVNDTRNFDPVDSDPNDAAFGNLPVPPPLPTVP